MDQCIDQRFSDCHVRWRFILSRVAFQVEGYGQDFLQLRKHPPVELKEVGLPCAVRTDAVYPSGGCVLLTVFSIVEKEMRSAGIVCYGVDLSKHQQSCQGEAFLSSLSVHLVATQFFQQ